MEQKRVSQSLQSSPFVFYVPFKECCEAIEEISISYWSWLNKFLDQQSFEFTGRLSWTLQSYIILRKHGLNVSLTHEFPTSGIVVTFCEFLRGVDLADSEAYIVEIKPDRNSFNCRSNAILIQNEEDPIRKGIVPYFIDVNFVYYWPQPALIERDLRRGSLFENVVFPGNAVESGLDSAVFLESCENLGLSWMNSVREHWNDYSQVDCVVAVRGSGGRDPYTKPATKLYNAWAAGVPAILSPDPAFMKLRDSEKDFIIARDEFEALEALKMLRNSPALREAMIKNGFERAKDFTESKVAAQWIDIFEAHLYPEYLKWRESRFKRFIHIYLTPKLIRILNRFSKFF